MKRLSTLLLSVLLAAPAAAQGLTITRSTPPQLSVPVLSELPEGWRLLRGRVRAPRAVRLPEGSRVMVRLLDQARPGSPLLEIEFPASKLSTPYQLQYNPVRLSPSRTYVVAASVVGPDGRVLYSGLTREVPSSRNAVMDLRVMSAR